MRSDYFIGVAPHVVLPMQAVGTASALSMNWICCVRNRCLCMLAATWRYAVRTTSGPYALLQCMLRAQRHAVIIMLALVRSPAKYACLQFKLTQHLFAWLAYENYYFYAKLQGIQIGINAVMKHHVSLRVGHILF